MTVRIMGRILSKWWSAAPFEPWRIAPGGTTVATRGAATASPTAADLSAFDPRFTKVGARSGLRPTKPPLTLSWPARSGRPVRRA